MSITLNPEVVVMTKEEKMQEQINEMRLANDLLKSELSALRAENPITTMVYLQTKVRRQGQVLNILQARSRTQRLVLRHLAVLDRGLDLNEWNQLKAENTKHFEDFKPLYI